MVYASVIRLTRGGAQGAHHLPMRWLWILFFVPSLAYAVDDETPPVELVARVLGVGTSLEGDVTPEQRAVALSAGDQLRSLCPHCRPQTLAEEGPCAWARAQRTVLFNAAAKGMDKDALVAAYLKAYGPNVRAVLPSSGAAAASWVVPYVAAALMLLGFGLWARKMRRKEAEAPTPAAPQPSDASREALDAELRALD